MKTITRRNVQWDRRRILKPAINLNTIQYLNSKCRINWNWIYKISSM